ncbi:MAG: SAM-dependent methyltransferase [Treponemataceae bacterium]|nr:SAM-dependent methyltransferase [Treponemataceae bacterium]
MILSATLSKPTAAVREAFGRDIVRVKVKIRAASTDGGAAYTAELFTKTQVFHQKMTAAELDSFLSAHAGTTFRSCVERTEHEEITILANKKGRTTRLAKPLPHGGQQAVPAENAGENRTKAYLLREGVPVPFLVRLGVMTAQGKVIAAKYDKFRQVNRFLEYVDDVLDDVIAARAKADSGAERTTPLRIVDFGSGKSYLTFAVQYFLTEIRHIDCEITGLDLKEDVVAWCNALAQSCGCQNLRFAVGDIVHYGDGREADIVMTLHACDTATDYALDYAVRHHAAAILSVPCCQHELNAQLDYRALARPEDASPFAPLLKHGLLKERFAALATDALRAAYLEDAGYKVTVLEFIDESHTPKNLLIRAVRKASGTARTSARAEADRLLDALGVTQTFAQARKNES